MIYRILKSPPGYPSDQNYLVAAYNNLDYKSSICYLETEDGRRFVATLEEARRLIPDHAKRIPFEPENQFLELWETRQE
jgi:hypothetical protein